MTIDVEVFLGRTWEGAQALHSVEFSVIPLRGEKIDINAGLEPTLYEILDVQHGDEPKVLVISGD